MLIRKITPDDAEKFVSFLKQLDEETQSMMYEPGERRTSVEDMETSIKSLSQTESLILIAEDEKTGQITGFLSAERGFAARIRHSAYIVVGVHHEFRGRKVGLGLLTKLDEWARDKAIKRLELTVMTHNFGAIRLYEKVGFKIEGVREKSMIVDGKYIDEFYMGKIT